MELFTLQEFTLLWWKAFAPRKHAHFMRLVKKGMTMYFAFEMTKKKFSKKNKK